MKPNHSSKICSNLRRTAVAAFLGALMFGAAPAMALDKVTMLFPGPIFLPGFAMYTMPKYKGYYEQEGLDVTFQFTPGGVNVGKQVGVGNGDVGIAIGDAPIILRANDVPIKAVAMLGGYGYLQIFAREGSGIASPADLKGKQVIVDTFTGSFFYAFLGVLSKVGLTKNDLDIQAAGNGPAAVKLFASGTGQALASTREYGMMIEAEGAKLVRIPGDRYFPTMPDTLMMSDKAIAERPKVVTGLVRAVVKATREMLDDPKAFATAFAAAEQRSAGKERQLTELFDVLGKELFGGQQVVGKIDADRFEKVQDFYFSQGIIPKKSPIASLLTNEFVAP